MNARGDVSILLYERLINISDDLEKWYRKHINGTDDAGMP